MNLSTDYAIRAVCYIAKKHPMIVTIEDISINVGMSKNYLMKIISMLKKAQIIQSIAGKKGGIILAKRPEKITLWEIIDLVEGPIKYNKCLIQKSGYCSAYEDVSKCTLRKICAAYQAYTEDYFSAITIERIIEEERKLQNEEIK